MANVGENGYAQLLEVFKTRIPGVIRFILPFEDPPGRINLPSYVNGKAKDFVRYRTADGQAYEFPLMSHAQAVNQFETAILEGIRDKSFRHPDVNIICKTAGEIVNLVEEPHRIYSAYICQKDSTDKEYTTLNGKPFNEEIIGSKLGVYNPDSRVHTRTALKYSPTTILFGGWGSHYGLSYAPKLTSLVEMGIEGRRIDNQVVSRRSPGSYMPKLAMQDSVQDKSDKDEKGRLSERGLASIPPSLSDNMGATTLKDIRLTCSFVLDRVSTITIGDDIQENAAVKVYMTALWFATFYRGLQRGFSHYHGRPLVMANAPEIDLRYKPMGLSCDQSAEKLRTLLKSGNQDFWEAVHNVAVDKLVQLKLLTLEPVDLIASPELDKLTFARRQQKKKKNGKKEKGSDE
jgi:hypothetical protein